MNNTHAVGWSLAALLAIAVCMQSVKPWTYDPSTILAAIVIAVLCGLAFFDPERGLLCAIALMPLYWPVPSMGMGRFLDGRPGVIGADFIIGATAAGLAFATWRRARPAAWECTADPRDARPGTRARLQARLRRFPLTAAAAILLLTWILSLWNSADVRQTMFNVAALGEMTVLVFVLEAVLDDRDRLQRALRVWAYSYLAVVGMGIAGVVAQYCGHTNFTTWLAPLGPDSLGPNARATFDYPGQLALFLVISFCLISPFFDARFGSPRLRRGLWLALPFAGLLLLASGSRTGLVVAGVAGVTLLLTQPQVRRPLLLTGFGLALVLALIPGGSRGGELAVARQRFGLLIQIARGQNLDFAFGFNRSTDALAEAGFRAHPLLGVGAGAIVYRDDTNGITYEMSSSYLGLLGETGLLGMAAAILLVAVLLQRLSLAWRNASSDYLHRVAWGAAAALPAVGVHAWTVFDWRLRHVWLLFGIIGALGAAAARQSLEGSIAEPAAAAVMATGHGMP